MDELISSETRERVGQAASTFGQFARSEVRGLLAVVGRAAGWAWLAVALPSFVYFTVGTLTGGGAGSPVSAPGRVALALVLSAYYGTCAALFVGLVAALFRLFGRWALVPVVTVPAAVLGVLWLLARPLLGEGADVVDAFRVALKGHDFKLSGMALLALGGPHGGGGPLLGVLLLIALPFLLADLVTILFEPPVLWQFVQFLALTGLTVALAALAALVVTAGPLLYGFVTRLRRRYRAFRGEAPAG